MAVDVLYQVMFPTHTLAVRGDFPPNIAVAALVEQATTFIKQNTHGFDVNRNMEEVFNSANAPVGQSVESAVSNTAQ